MHHLGVAVRQHDDVSIVNGPHSWPHVRLDGVPVR